MPFSPVVLQSTIGLNSRDYFESPMQTREIPTTEWEGMCSELKLAYGHSPVTLRVRKGEGIRELTSRPLADLVAHIDADSSIMISVGDPWEGYLGHAVIHPTRVRMLASRDRDELLVIDSADGSITELDFYPAD